MCTILYLATAMPIARGAVGPLTIESVADDVFAQLRDKITLPHVCRVLAGTCSCAFPAMPAPELMPYEDCMGRGESRAHEIELMTALLSLLRAALATGPCELLPIGIGIENRAATCRHELRLADLDPQSFQFAEQCVHSIAANPDRDPTRTN